MTAENDSLSVWNVQVHTTRSLKAAAKRTAESADNQSKIFKASDEVDVGLYDAFDRPVNVNEFLMCCYLNIGFEPRVGARKCITVSLSSLKTCFHIYRRRATQKEVSLPQQTQLLHLDDL